jgi:hypothetical protein
MSKIVKRILIVVALLGVAVAAGSLGDWAVGRKPPPPRVIPVGAALVEGDGTASGKVKTLDLSFDLLKKWTYVEGKSQIPPFIRAFDGQNVQMAGYMMPLQDVKSIKSFVLVPSLFGCCYGQPPAVNHVVLVKMGEGKTAKYFGDTILVRGQFHSGEEKDDGYVVSLYRIDAEQIIAQ